MLKLEYYEFVGVLAPGVVTLFGATLLWPDLGAILRSAEFTVGDLGVFLVLAFVTGHLIQAVGNLIEWGWWKVWRGIPTEWLFGGKPALLGETQSEEVRKAVGELLRLPVGTTLSDVDADSRRSASVRVYGIVAAASRAARLDTFNGNYGLFRGVLAAMLTLLVLTAVRQQEGWLSALLLLAAGAALALFRMHRFGVHYARELYLQFLQIQRERAKGPGAV